MHTLHGRALAVATGLKLANHDLTVLVTGGDGDGFGIGGNHFIHTMRRNVDLLYIVMDNQIYGLTTGQTSPTRDRKSTRLNSSHGYISYAVFCLKKKKTIAFYYILNYATVILEYTIDSLDKH